MIRNCLSLVIAGVLMLASLVLIGTPTSAEAGAVALPGVAAGLKADVTGLSTSVVPVHGCHRQSRIGPWTGLRHRHVGPGCRWVRAGHRRGRNACSRWRQRCANRCYDAPRPNRCRRRCFNNNAPGFCF